MRFFALPILACILLVCAVCLLCATCLPCTVRAGDTPAPESSATEKPASQPGSHVSIITQSDGNRALSIETPWQAYKKPSVEVRLLTGGPPDGRPPLPLNFASELLKGEMSVKVGQCLLSADGAGATQEIKHGEMKFSIVGQRNSYGQPAVYVAWRNREGAEPTTPSERAEARPLETWAAYCELEHWAVNRHRLYLDLPEEYFGRPGKLYVWFLREDSVIWEEQFDWKGY